MRHAIPWLLAVLCPATLARAQDHAPAGSIAVVVPAPPAGVRIASGAFVMGAGPADVDLARTLCRHDVEAFAALRRTTVTDPAVALGYTLQMQLCAPELVVGLVCGGAAFAAETTAHEVWLPAFGMDRTEVTVAAYDACVTAGVCAPPLDAPGTPHTGAANLPVTGVRWNDAATYCAWTHGRLPTEAEWERAARGRDARPFPWGWIADGARCNHGAIGPTCRDDGDDGFALAAPVGSFPAGASPEGVLDLAGNVLEWVADRASADGVGYAPDRVAAPRGPAVGAERRVRGGAWDLPLLLARSTARLHRPASERARDLGFRCAHDLR